MTIKHVRGTCYWDVFLGEGWAHWTRIKVVNGTGVVVDGITLHAGLVRDIVENG